MFDTSFVLRPHGTCIIVEEIVNGGNHSSKELHALIVEDLVILINFVVSFFIYISFISCRTVYLKTYLLSLVKCCLCLPGVLALHIFIY